MRVSRGSTTASRGRSATWLIPVFTLSDSTSSTQIVVLSLPVPVVVGTATSGSSGLTGARALPTGRVDVVHQLAGVGQQQVDRLGGVDRRAAADRDAPRRTGARRLGVRAKSTASPSDSSVGSTRARSKIDDLDAARPDLLGDPGRVTGGRDARRR